MPRFVFNIEFSLVHFFIANIALYLRRLHDAIYISSPYFGRYFRGAASAFARWRRGAWLAFHVAMLRLTFRPRKMIGLRWLVDFRMPRGALLADFEEFRTSSSGLRITNYLPRLVAALISRLAASRSRSCYRRRFCYACRSMHFTIGRSARAHRRDVAASAAYIRSFSPPRLTQPHAAYYRSASKC